MAYPSTPSKQFAGHNIINLLKHAQHKQAFCSWRIWCNKWFMPRAGLHATLFRIMGYGLPIIWFAVRVLTKKKKNRTIYIQLLRKYKHMNNVARSVKSKKIERQGLRKWAQDITKPAPQSETNTSPWWFRSFILLSQMWWLGSSSWIATALPVWSTWFPGQSGTLGIVCTGRFGQYRKLDEPNGL